MHTSSTSAAHSRASVFASCWQQPTYLSLHARKDRIGAAWNRADAQGRPEAVRLGKVLDRIVSRITAFEDSALGAAGLRP